MQVTGLIHQLEGFGNRWTIPSSASCALVGTLFRHAHPADLDALQEHSPIASAEFSPSLPALRTQDGDHNRRTGAIR
jgi:hypothetical protein